MKRVRGILIALCFAGIGGCATSGSNTDDADDSRHPSGGNAPPDLPFNIMVENEIEALWEEVQSPGGGGDEPTPIGQ